MLCLLLSMIMRVVCVLSLSSLFAALFLEMDLMFFSREV